MPNWVYKTKKGYSIKLPERTLSSPDIERLLKQLYRVLDKNMEYAEWWIEKKKTLTNYTEKELEIFFILTYEAWTTAIQKDKQ